MVSHIIVKSRFFTIYKEWLETETKCSKDAEVNEKAFFVINH